MQLQYGIWAWSMSPLKYVWEEVMEYGTKCLSKDFRWPNKAEYPFSVGYCSLLNQSPVLGLHEASYHLSLIGLMRQMVEIGCIDTSTRVSILLSYLAMP